MALEEKLNTIALCLPGGGFRAAGFCLGILAFLEEMDLLKNVRAISTVSGGTITGMKYAQMMKDGKTYTEFYEEMYTWLKENQLASQAIATLKNKSTWETQYPHKRRNLINAFAIQYNQFIPGTLGELEEYLALPSSKLERCIFNSTDFNHGVEFRFQNKDIPQRDFGNAYQDGFYRDIRHEILLGDVVAASSCFPAGFEPLAFPGDFVQKESLMKIPDDAEPIGLMDGGIIDNQGSSSLSTGQLNYEFYAVGDVGSSGGTPFTFSDNLQASKWISTILNPWLLVLSLFAMIVTLAMDTFMLKYVFTVLASILVTLHILLYLGYRYAQNMANLSESVILDPRKIGIYLMDRVRSVITLNNVIFLKGAKSRNITNIFTRAPNRVEKISIYELADFEENLPVNPESHKQTLNGIICGISPKLVQASRESVAFATTLWFEDDRGEMLDQLILTGKATTCLSLMSFLLKVSNQHTCENDAFFQKLLKWWRTYQ